MPGLSLVFVTSWLLAGMKVRSPQPRGCRVNGYLSRKQKVQSHDERGKREPLHAWRDPPGAWEQPDLPARAGTN